MREDLFDLSEQYEAMLNQGIRLSGEDQHYFIAGRVGELKRQMGEKKPRRILDFGCGIGHTSDHLAREFPTAEVVGVDTAEKALEYAAGRYGGPRVRFRCAAEFQEEEGFDLCYVNGVFHHVEPENRLEVAAVIRRALVRGGYFAMFENNPWNPGTRMVMRRIPFDRNARTLTPPEAERLLEAAGFRRAAPTRSLFYFPRFLSWLRFSEPWLGRLPLGSQYCVLAEKP